MLGEVQKKSEGSHLEKNKATNVGKEKRVQIQLISYMGPDVTTFSQFLTPLSTLHSPEEVHRLWMKRCAVSDISSMYNS